MSHAARTQTCEERPKYEITHRLTAYSKELPGNGHVLEKGTVIRIDPDFAWDNTAVSALIVRFVCGDVWFYLDRETFERSTRIADPLY